MVNLAYLRDGWAGAGAYGDLTDETGRPENVDFTHLSGSEYEGHVHEIPLVPIGTGDRCLDAMLGIDVFDEDEIRECLDAARDLLEDAGWSDIFEVSAADFKATVLMETVESSL